MSQWTWTCTDLDSSHRRPPPSEQKNVRPYVTTKRVSKIVVSLIRHHLSLFLSQKSKGKKIGPQTRKYSKILVKGTTIVAKIPFLAYKLCIFTQSPLTTYIIPFLKIISIHSFTPLPHTPFHSLALPLQSFVFFTHSDTSFYQSSHCFPISLFSYTLHLFFFIIHFSHISPTFVSLSFSILAPHQKAYHTPPPLPCHCLHYVMMIFIIFYLAIKSSFHIQNITKYLYKQLFPYFTHFPLDKCIFNRVLFQVSCQLQTRFHIPSSFHHESYIITFPTWYWFRIYTVYPLKHFSRIVDHGQTWPMTLVIVSSINTLSHVTPTPIDASFHLHSFYTTHIFFTILFDFSYTKNSSTYHCHRLCKHAVLQCHHHIDTFSIQ